MHPKDLLDWVQQLYDACLTAEHKAAAEITRLPETQRASAANFIHYLAVRQYDLRGVHDSLSDLGISSLRFAEPYTLHNLQQVIHLLSLLTDRPNVAPAKKAMDLAHGRGALANNAETLFGSAEGAGRVMVTIDPDDCDNESYLTTLLQRGMAIARINGAHGNPQSWHTLICSLRDVSERIHRPCRIYFDLAGPKIRLAALPFGKHSMPLREGEQLKLVFNRDYFDPKQADMLWVDAPEIFHDIATGHPVLLSDGRFSARVVAVDALCQILHISIHYAEPGKKLKAQKGVNFPESQLNIRSITPSDEAALAAIGADVDVIGLPFVRSRDDIQGIQEKLQHLGLSHKGLVAKIETRQAVQELPAIIMQLLHSNDAGVMVARGDLAVEIGFERVAEIQEQILWLCEAAHLPTIWATHVLQNLNKRGLATRAEVTDAAMSGRAECVMLNTGKYQLEALVFLKDVLRRMGDHRHKKSPLMRPLSMARGYLSAL